MANFDLTDKQADAMLMYETTRLTGLERDRLEDEYRELIKTIAYLTEVLANERLLMGIIKTELSEIVKFGDERKSPDYC